MCRRLVWILSAWLAANSTAPAQDWITGFIDVGPGVYDPAVSMVQDRPSDGTTELADRVLDLEPNADNRRAMQRIREAATTTEVGVDVSRQDWVEVDNLHLTWGGRVHTDMVLWPNSAQFGGQSNYTEFRRLRLMASGEGYGVYFYQLDLEFAPTLGLDGGMPGSPLGSKGNGVEVKDAYVGLRHIPTLGTIRAGHFFTPIGLESQTGSNFLTFMERSLATTTLPGRELGLGVNNQTANKRMSWGYGVFFHDLDESSHAFVDDNQGLRLVGRITALPYYDELTEGRCLLHAGIGYAYTRPHEIEDAGVPGAVIRPVEFGARPEIHRGDELITTDIMDTHQYHLINSELAWIQGPFSVQSEFAWTSLDTFTQGMVNLFGTYASVSYFLTGEHRTYNRWDGTFRRVVPLENSFLVPTPRGPCGGRGAWEMAARWSYLDFSDASGQRMNDLTLGINWYLNPRVRLMMNWIHPMVDHSPLSDQQRAVGDAIAMRLQFDF